MFRLLLPLVIVACVSLGPVEKGDHLSERPELVEGDIALPHDPTDRNSQFEWKLWPSGIIPYVISDELKKHEDKIKKVMDYIKKATDEAVRFIEKEVVDTDYLKIFDGGECWSYVGRKGGEQEMSLSEPCLDPGVLLHELTHIIGFFHEHNRYDRDDYITIHWENIWQGMEGHFTKLKEGEAVTYDSFDYKSIMMYHGWFAAKESGLNTMTPKQEGVELNGFVGRMEYSDSDLLRIQEMYDQD